MSLLIQSDKICIRCCVSKSINEFSTHDSCRDGHRPVCKVCCSSKRKIQRETDPANEQKIQATYYAKHRDVILEKKRAEYHSAGQIRYQTAKHGAKHRNIIWQLEYEQWKDIVSFPCAWCGADNINHGLDRIDNNTGYTLDNVISCCWPCNDLRGNLSASQFITLITRIYEHAKHNA